MTGLSTLCYIEKDGKYLMLHRTVKKNDVNKEKWIGVGGTERCNLWFAGFWPAEKPRYTIVVLQDGAVHTAYSGAAIFAQVCNALEAAG